MRFFNNRFLLDPAAAGAGGNGGKTEIATGDITLSDPAFDKLGLSDSLRGKPLANGPASAPASVTPDPNAAGAAGKAKPGETKPAAKTETAEAKATREAAEAAAAGTATKTPEELTAEIEADRAARAQANGVTVEEQQAADEAETLRVETKAAELGKSIDEVLALEAEELAASAAPELTPEAKTYVEKLTADHAAEVERLTTEKAAADAKAADLEATLAQTKRPAMRVMNIHPLLMAATEADIATQEQQLENFEKWAIEHWDGSEAVEARGDQPGAPAYTAAQIRARYQEVKQLKEKLVPQAKALLQQRTAMVTTAQVIYPALFDSKRPESKVVQNFLGNYPELQAVIPNFHIVTGDAILGEQIRLALSNPKHKSHAQTRALFNALPELKGLLAVKAVPTPSGRVIPGKPLTPGAGGATGKPPGKVPRPGGTASASRSVSAAGKAAAAGPSVQTLQKNKASGMNERDALAHMVRGMTLPTAVPAGRAAE